MICCCNGGRKVNDNEKDRRNVSVKGGDMIFFAQRPVLHVVMPPGTPEIAFHQFHVGGVFCVDNNE